MDVYYDYYKIDVADIWQYEQELFLRAKSSNDLAKYIIEKAEDLIINEGKESFIVNLNDEDERNRKYYERNLDDYKLASKTLKGRYEMNYFFKKDSCYEFIQHVIIKRENPDFDFWFALKLRQYDSKLIEVKNFLEFQMERSFNKDLIRFIDFLKLEMKQFRDTIFNDGITETIDGWIINKNSLNRKLRGKYSSLRLRELNTNPKYLKNNSHILSNVLKQLKANNFIHKDTLFTDFCRIFEGNIIPLNKRIFWTGKNIYLHWFMKYLVSDSEKVELHKHDIWVVANKCFVNENGMEFGTNRLRWAKSENEARKKLLESILAKI